MTSHSLRGRWLVPTWLGLVLLAAYALLAPACTSWDGHFDILGYTTRPNYDTRFKSIRVQIFRNRTPWSLVPVPGMEMDLTRAVIREIEWKTPYRVISGNADTELRGTIVSFTKNLLNDTPFNTVREAETVMRCELIWRDLHTGEILLKPQRRPGEALPPDRRQPLLASPDTPGGMPPGMRGVPSIGPSIAETSGALAGGGAEDDGINDPLTRKKAIPVAVQSTGHFRPELGESLTTALQQNYDGIAVQTVSVMEKGW